MAKRSTSKRRDDDDASEATAPSEHGEDDTGTAGSEKRGGAPAAAQEEEVVISVPVHCDGCARKLRRSLQRLDGVGEANVDSRTNTVVLRGPGAVESAADAVVVVERKIGKKATLLSPSPAKPIPLFPASAAAGMGSHWTKKSGPGGSDTAGDEEITAVDMEMVTVLRINLHCDACCEEIKRRILKIQGVKEAAPLLKSSQVVVKGMVEPATLVGFIHRSTGRKAAIIRAEPLDLLLPTPQMEEAEMKHVDEDPSAKSGETNNDGDMNNYLNEQAPQGVGNNKGEKEEEDNINVDNKKQQLRTEKHVPTTNGGGDEFVVERRNKDDHLLVGAPTPPAAGVVAPETVAAMNGFNDPPRYMYPAAYFRYPPPQPYPYAYYSCNPATYGYPHYGPPDQAFTEENPNACTIV